MKQAFFKKIIEIFVYKIEFWKNRDKFQKKPVYVIKNDGFKKREALMDVFDADVVDELGEEERKGGFACRNSCTRFIIDIKFSNFSKKNFIKFNQS